MEVRGEAGTRGPGPRPAASWIEAVFPFLVTIRTATKTTLRLDLSAALTVALFTVPQGMAYALIAGLPPAAGIWSSVVASIFGAAFGSSEFLINGPTNAMSVLLAANAAVFAAHGDPVEMIILLTLMIGLIQLGGAALKLGRFTRFVSEAVLTGFTAGAGLYIVVSQLASVLGIEKKALTPTLFGWAPPAGAALFDLLRTLASVGKTNWVTLAIGASTFILVRLFQWAGNRTGHRIPAPFFAVVIVTFVGWALDLGAAGPNKLKLVRDIEPIARSLPHLWWPAGATFDQLSELFTTALAIGVLGAVEAIAIGKLLATKVEHEFDANRQLVGEGLCNVGAALVGGFASSGSFTRTAVNFEAGAATRLSCIFSGLMVMAIVLAFAPAANLIPIAALAGTLVHVGLKLVDASRIRQALRATTSDRWTLAVTFGGVLVTAHLQTALFAGIIVSLVQALRRAEGFKLARFVESGNGHLVERPMDEACGDIAAVDLRGELFFATAEELEVRLRAILKGGTRFLVLRLAQAYNFDLTTASALASVARAAKTGGGRLILTGVRPGTLGVIQRAGLVEEIGEDAIFPQEPEILAATSKGLAYAHQLAEGIAKQTARA